MSATNARALNTMRQRVKKHNAGFQKEIEAFREHPVSSSEDEPEGAHLPISCCVAQTFGNNDASHAAELSSTAPLRVWTHMCLIHFNNPAPLSSIQLTHIKCSANCRGRGGEL